MQKKKKLICVTITTPHSESKTQSITVYSSEEFQNMAKPSHFEVDLIQGQKRSFVSLNLVI